MDNAQVDQLGQFLSLFDFQKIFTFIIGIILLIGFVKLVTWICDRLEVLFPSRRLLISQIETIISFFLYIFGINFLFFSIIQPPKELLIAAGGSIAVAIGLSLKDLVASIIAGLILLFDRPFQVGDRVSFEGFYGEIKSIGLRAVRLVTLDDNLITIPNSKFITEAVSSANAGALDMMILVNFYFDLSVNLKLVRQNLTDVITTSPYVYLEKPVTVVINEVMVAGRPALKLTGKCYVVDVKYEKTLETDIYSRAADVFKDYPRPSGWSPAESAQLQN